MHDIVGYHIAYLLLQQTKHKKITEKIHFMLKYSVTQCLSIMEEEPAVAMRHAGNFRYQFNVVQKYSCTAQAEVQLTHHI